MQLINTLNNEFKESKITKKQLDELLKKINLEEIHIFVNGEFVEDINKIKLNDSDVIMIQEKLIGA
jgi:ribosome-associated protein YbcJ (S4-like RNA binding protein)